MIVLKREGLTLHPDVLAAVREAILDERPDFAPRVAQLTFQKSVQPFFSNHTIIYANSAVPMPARFVVLALGPAGQGAPLLLTKHIERLRAIAALDPPPDLGLQDTAQAYALYGGGWTTMAVNGEMRLESFEHIPWFELDAAQKAEVEVLRARFAARIHPEKVIRSAAGWEFKSWIIADRKLIQRTMKVPLDGQLERTDVVEHEQLAVPEGKHWGTRDGRHVPVG